jgi:hypothetical protein
MLSQRDIVEIRKLLQETQMLAVKYCGPIYANWSRRLLFYDADFLYYTGEIMTVSEYIQGSYKDKLKRIIEILSESDCHVGTVVKRPYFTKLYESKKYYVS